MVSGRIPSLTQVLIAGGGPFGLMLANELGRRGIAVVLVDQNPGTTQNAAANATQARTMEHFRRLGFADEVRALGLPPDFPTDIAYFTRFARHELARFSLPSSRDARQLVTTLSGSWSAAELPHRCNQKFIEPVLRRHAEALPGVSVNYGVRMQRFRDLGREVEVELDGGHTIKTQYLVGADGPRSTVRQALGIRYGGETGVTRPFVGGRMYAVHARMPDFYRVVPHRPAWMNVAFNPERRCFMPAVDGKGEFAFHTQLHSHEKEDSITEEQAKAMVQQTVGLALRVEVIARAPWTAGHSLVAEKFGEARVFIGGDAAHLFTPTGGLGYNTAIEDAVNLGWKLAAVLKGTASEKTPRQLRRGTPAARAAQYGVRQGLRRFARQLRAAAGDRGRHAGRRSGAQARGRVLRGAWTRRIQHPGHHFRRPLRRLAGNRPGRQRTAARHRQSVCLERQPGRAPAAPVDARRALALRSVRLRMDASRFRSRRSWPIPI
jgi:2-polyprenyl-6-methoxyphenol hydroxylase-like FAD-dependent oxidoreductase